MPFVHYLKATVLCWVVVLLPYQLPTTQNGYMVHPRLVLLEQLVVAFCTTTEDYSSTRARSPQIFLSLYFSDCLLYTPPSPLLLLLLWYQSPSVRQSWILSSKLCRVASFCDVTVYVRRCNERSVDAYIEEDGSDTIKRLQCPLGGV